MKICEDICDIHHSKSVCVKAHVGSNPTLSVIRNNANPTRFYFVGEAFAFAFPLNGIN